MSRVVPEGRDAYWTHTDEVRARVVTEQPRT